MHLLAMDDLSADDLRSVIAGGPVPDLAGKVVVLLDFLPLGVERLVLERAVARCGARLVAGAGILPGFPEGADLLEAARIAGAYADLIVVRHPWRGAARAAADLSPAPVLNAGDGTGGDPLFAVADLAALARGLRGLAGRSVALCGDLRRNRRAHSLAVGLTALGARVLLVPARGAEPDSALLDRLAEGHGTHPVRFGARSMSSLLSMVDAWLLTPDLSHQLSLFSDLVASSEGERRAVRHQVKRVDAIWVAAPRDEEGEPRDDEGRGLLPWRSEDVREFVSPLSRRRTVEDRVGRASSEVPAVSTMLSLALERPPVPEDLPGEVYRSAEGVRCENRRCVACREPRRVVPAFRVLRADPVLLSCLFCGARRKVRCVASRVERKLHEPTSSQVRKILPRNTVYFATKGEAEAAGYVPSRIG